LNPFNPSKVLDQLPKPELEASVLEPPSTPSRTTPQDLVNYYLQVPETPRNSQEAETLFHQLYNHGILNSTTLHILQKLEKGATKAFTDSRIQQATNNSLIKAAKESRNKKKFDKAKGFGRVMGVEVLMQRQAEFIQKVIDSTWQAQYSHLDPDLFTSQKPKTKPKPNRGPNKRVWHAATKEFRKTEPDIFTIDIELAPASPILEQESPKKRKTTALVPMPAKRRRYTKKPIVEVIELDLEDSELAEIPVVQSRAGRVVRRTDKAKGFY